MKTLVALIVAAAFLCVGQVALAKKGDPALEIIGTDSADNVWYYDRDASAKLNKLVREKSPDLFAGVVQLILGKDKEGFPVGTSYARIAYVFSSKDKSLYAPYAVAIFDVNRKQIGETVVFDNLTWTKIGPNSMASHTRSKAQRDAWRIDYGNAV